MTVVRVGDVRVRVRHRVVLVRADGVEDLKDRAARRAGQNRPEGLDLLVRIRQQNDVWCAPHYSISDAKQIRETLAITVLQPIERLQRDLLGVEDCM